MKKASFLQVVTILALVLSRVPTIASTELKVDSTSSLANAINNAIDGDTIVLKANITLDTLLPEIVSQISVDGNGNSISGDGRFRIFNVGRNGALILSGVTLSDGKPGDDCAHIDRDGNTVLVASVCGGAILSLGDLTIEDSIFTANSSDYGGAIYSRGNLAISDSEFRNNSALSGAAVDQDGGSISVKNSVFKGNVASEVGGAIFHGGWTLSGNLQITDSLFVDNASGSNGGAIIASGIMRISQSAFVANTAGDGGAIHGAFAENMYIDNSTFTENSARGSGGAILASGSATLSHLTIAKNRAEAGGGLQVSSWSSSDQVNLRNSIVALNIGGDCHGLLNQDIGNLVQDGSCLATNSGNPSFGELVEPNDGSTPYLPLAIGSVAIDAAHAAYCTATDQRGVSRPQGEACDIGAFEYVREE